MKSKTHSKNICINIDDHRYRSVGIDLEFYKKRNPKLKDYVANIKDKNATEMSILEVWTAKESCFKAISNLNKNIKFLHEVEIDYQNKTFEFEELKGNFHFKKNEECIIAISYIS